MSVAGARGRKERGGNLPLGRLLSGPSRSGGECDIFASVAARQVSENSQSVRSRGGGVLLVGAS